ncbi:hypothetical protein ACFO1B_05115 [Dactylosporangium siamense]|uniref:Uncharacterized protein n=1 Tax=Dactylosporangium siamense TaxID=685454 RepID=A0A919U5U4_9ACTN|nr:hypothetical protein [Dactylosporangium siamense]GIG42732.1 hypothetical protein Dsi01nite_007730 [Dactylosporangium siamense]
MERVLGPGEVERGLAELRPRDTGFWTVDVAEPGAAWAVVQELPLERLVLAGVAAGPGLLDLVRAALGYDPGAQEFLTYLRGGFPPAGDVPPVPERLIDAGRGLALGAPGEPVAHGLFPSTVTKLSRLALARQRLYPPDTVLEAARRAYRGPYDAHEALACALVHPDVDTDALVWQHTRRGRGWRSRRKTNRVLAWARRHGYLAEPLVCGCRHERLEAPGARWEAARLAANWTRILPLLDEVAVDPARWLAVYRCSRCERLWARDTVSSGHADLTYGYPIATDDPAGWLAAARPNNLR